MKNLFSLTLIFTLFLLSSCSKEYICECTTIVGGVTTQSTIEEATKSAAKNTCDEGDAEILGIPITDCEII